MGAALTRLVVATSLSVVAFSFALRTEPERANACGAFGAYEFDTFEYEDYIADYNQLIDLAVEGKAIGLSYTLDAGDHIDVTYQGLESGMRGSRLPADPGLRIPPTVYKSIAWIEAAWSHGATGPTGVPYGGVGRVLRSFDCGYGIGQVTSGMSNATGVASGRQAAIGTHVLFNVAEGVRILADKWNSAPNFRPVAGTGDPAALEDWYYAIWSYNGFAFSNHPLYPERDVWRGEVYHCFDPGAPGVDVFGYGDYTYSERVYGCMRYPPTVTLPTGGTAKLFTAVEFSMPNLALAEIADAFEIDNFTDCEDAGFSGGCPSMDYPTTIPEHEVVTHADPTSSRDASEASLFLGAPLFQATGPEATILQGFVNGSATSTRVVISNGGTGVAPFRIRTSAPWIVVRHPGQTRNLDGGVAIGAETQVVIQKFPRLFTNGYESILDVTLDPALMAGGTQVGTLFIDPLFGAGTTYKLTIVATKGLNSFPYKSRAPGLIRE